MNPAYFNEKDLEHLPGLLDVKVTEVDKGALKSKLEVSKKHLAINGYLHAGTVIPLADTSSVLKNSQASARQGKYGNPLLPQNFRVKQ